MEKQLAQLHPAFSDSYTTTDDKQRLLVDFLGESDSAVDIETMLKRNGRITDRVDIRKIVIDDREKTILHNGISSTIKKVCAHGHVYASQSDASSALKRSDNYVNGCIKNDTYPDDIFEISDEFYEEYKDSENITKTMFIGFDHYYTNM